MRRRNEVSGVEKMINANEIMADALLRIAYKATYGETDPVEMFKMLKQIERIAMDARQLAAMADWNLEALS